MLFVLCRPAFVGMEVIMKQFFRKALSGCLALSLACGLAVPAAASDALGEDLTQKEIVLNEETQLSTNVFWSTTYSDLRTENFITYTPNDDVTPIVMAGDVLTARDTVSKAAAKLEEEGYTFGTLYDLTAQG